MQLDCPRTEDFPQLGRSYIKHAFILNIIEYIELLHYLYLLSLFVFIFLQDTLRDPRIFTSSCPAGLRLHVRAPRAMAEGDACIASQRL